jgi:hypothetical protein
MKHDIKTQGGRWMMGYQTLVEILAMKRKYINLYVETLK